MKQNQIQATKGQPPVVPLKEGQVWAFDDQLLEIKHVGKYLVESLVRQKDPEANGREHIRIGKHLESIEVVQKFLRAHKAVLEEMPAETPMGRSEG